MACRQFYRIDQEEVLDTGTELKTEEDLTEEELFTRE